MRRCIIAAATAVAALTVTVGSAGAAKPTFDSAEGAGSIAPGSCATGRSCPGRRSVSPAGASSPQRGFGGHVISQDPGSPDVVGVPFVVYVADNGPADSGLDLVSPLGVFPQGDADLALLPAGFPRVCPPAVPSLYGYFPVTQGNVVVDDESPGVTVG